MRTTRLLGAFLLGQFLLSGCASTLRVTYHSDPEGAMLYANQNQQLFGYTPVTLHYKPPQSFLQGRSCWNLQPSMVRWGTGAEASVTGLTVCPQNGLSQQFVFARPTDFPGREIDAQFALQLQQNAALAKQAAAQQTAAFWQAYSALIQRNQQALRTLQCTSQLVGYMVYTSCR